MTNKTVNMSRELAERIISAFSETGKIDPDYVYVGQIAKELNSILAAPVVERQPVCGHEWTDDGQFLLICKKCGAQENHDPKWLDMANAPKDGTLVRLLVEFEEHSTEDEAEAPTIGANNFDNDEHDEWLFAGWCWTHDHWTQGKGAPIGWLPMTDTSPPAPVSMVLPERRDFSPQSDSEWGWNACLDKVKELNQ